MTILKNLRETRSADSAIAQFISARNRNEFYDTTGFNPMQNSAVYACTSLIADAISTLPVDVIEKRGDARMRLETPTIIDDPSSIVSSTAWRRQILMSWLFAGNTYGLITEYDQNFYPLTIEILDPNSITVEEEDGQVVFYSNGNKLDAARLIHKGGLVLPGSPIGYTPISYASGVLKVSESAMRFAREYYAKGVKTNGILAYKSERVDEAKALRTKQKFIEAAQNAYEPVVLSGELSYTPLSISPQDTQFLETAKATIQDICRYFAVPPEVIGSESGKSMTYSTVEGNSRQVLQYTLNPWIVRLEEFLTDLLPSGQQAKVNRNAALAIDLQARYNAHSLGIRTGFLSANDVRALEDLPPINEGNLYVWPPFTTAPDTPSSPLGQ